MVLATDECEVLERVWLASESHWPQMMNVSTERLNHRRWAVLSTESFYRSSGFNLATRCSRVTAVQGRRGMALIGSPGLGEAVESPFGPAGGLSAFR
jgi:hypothetical protein